MRQFLMSLLNATLLLAVVLAALVVWLSYRAEDVAADLIAKVDIRVLDAAEADVRNAVAEIHGLRSDLATLNTRLARLADGREITLSPAMRQELDTIRAHAVRIEKAVANVTNVDRALSDSKIREIGKMLTEAVIDVRSCRSAAGNV